MPVVRLAMRVSSLALLELSLVGCTGAVGAGAEDGTDGTPPPGTAAPGPSGSSRPGPGGATSVPGAPGGPAGPGAMPTPGAPSTPGAPAAEVPPLPSGRDLRELRADPTADGSSLRLRGLTRDEYDNTLAAILGDTSKPARRFGEEVKGDSGFLEPRPVSGKEVTDFTEAAGAIATRAKSQFARLSACDVASKGEDACVRSFVASFGRKAFRRPLLAEEEADYTGLFATVRKTHGQSLEDSVGLVIEAMLQSPSFLYHWQLGPRGPKGAQGGVVALTRHEVAARLSYFLTQSPPDDLLSAAADAGALDDEALQGHATRLLATPKAREPFQDFIAQMLDLTALKGSGDASSEALDNARRAFVE